MMKAPPFHFLRAVFFSAVFAVAAGLLFWSSRLGDGLQNLSYDLLFLCKPTLVPQEAVIVYVDEKSCRELQQDPKTWDRALHARLLDQLTADQAGLVVFDIVFSGARTAASDADLVRAIKANGRVVLAATQEAEAHQELTAVSLNKPREEFLAVAAGSGIAGLEADLVKRRFVPVTMLGSNLAWAAASRLAAPSPLRAPVLDEVRWLNYYGPQGTIPSVSFCEVKDQPPGFFKGKMVFVGGKPSTPHLFDQAEENQTPLTRWGDVYFPGVDLIATASLNLYRGESLTRLPRVLEALGLILCGLVFGLTMAAFRPKLAATATLFAVLLTALVLALLLVRQHVWFPWTILFFIQAPCALAWSVWFRPPDPKTPAVALPERTALTPPGLSPSVAEIVARIPREPSFAPEIPDHDMLRSVGMGAYGDVWLARNAVGIYRAVKVVYRDAFENEDPYNREFRGITRFMPISLEHPKLVHLVHVGRNDAQGYFYCIMEAADDEVSGQDINPTTYSPRSLSKELGRRGRLPARECLELGIELAAALAYLHGKNLIHRDIKPANIIYVGGVPKIADIGLVTAIQNRPQETTYVGTEGYIAPEGPGEAMGDVFSLGKVLYQAATGLRVDQFPLLPTTLVQQGDDAVLLELNRVVLKACENNRSERFHTAGELLAALSALKERLAN